MSVVPSGYYDIIRSGTCRRIWIFMNGKTARSYQCTRPNCTNHTSCHRLVYLDDCSTIGFTVPASVPFTKRPISSNGDVYRASFGGTRVILRKSRCVKL